MPDYITFPIETDPEILAQGALEYIQSKIPGWSPAEGNLEVILIEALARMASVVRTLASEAPTSVFRYFGNTIMQIPPVDASYASGRTTWSVRDDAGYTIPFGALVGIRVSGDVLVPFQVLNTVTIAPGDTETAVGEVIIEALDAGSGSSGLSGNLEMINPLDWVTDIGLTPGTTTTGGEDAEADQAYLDRLAGQLALMAPRPILPRDFAAMAQNVAGVDRAMVLDGYNPADDTFNNERMVTVIPVDPTGQTVGTPIKAAVDAYLQSHREANFDIHIIDPTYTQIDVTFTATAQPGFDPAMVQAAAIANVLNYLSPANWGQPPTRTREWIYTPLVVYLEVAQAILDTRGLDKITTGNLTINAFGDSPGVVDVVLAGRAPMPIPGTITGTVVAP